MATTDNRQPNPPMGYSCNCELPRDQQLSLVAEFHVHRIRPSRIAYRLGIDIARVEAWLAGEEDPERFKQLLQRHRRLRYHAELRRADRLKGQQAFEIRRRAQQDLNLELGL
jgi:hypothetical protein